MTLNSNGIMKTNSPILLIIISSIFFGLFATQVQAFTPTAAQIEQFKRLPQAQQQALAKQYGIPLSAIAETKLNNKKMAEAQFNEPLETPEKPEELKINHDIKTIEENKSFKKGSYKRKYYDSNNSGFTQSPLTNQESSNKENIINTNQLEKPLSLFGYELFNQDPNDFTPSGDIPTPNNYIIGPGDSIIVQLYGKNNANHSLIVSREGRIQFPEIGPITVAGLTFVELKTLLKQNVEKQMIGVEASITMGTLRSIRVFILGEANKPGSYTVRSLSTMTNALLISGGINKIGSLRNIQLKRQGKLITNLDLYDLLLKGDTSKDVRLLPGDVIFVPPIGQTVAIDGEVRRPAIYEIHPQNTLHNVINLAGGLLPTAFPQASIVERIDSSGQRILLDIDLSSTSGQAIAAQDADYIEIPPILDAVKDVILVEGHVKRPGGFTFKEGQHFTDLVNSANALLANPDLNAALIIREAQPTKVISTLLFNPAKAFEAPKTKVDPSLQTGDRIVLFGFNDSPNRSELLTDIISQLNRQANHQQQRQIVEIKGSVRFPGTYPLTNNMTAADLIKLSGGLTDRSYTLDAEITRYDFSATSSEKVEHINFSFSEAINKHLQPEDNLMIKDLPNWIGNETVTISGEVAFPGTYNIQRGETLAQVLKRAGGLNQYAFSKAAIFTRKSLKENEQKHIENMKDKLSADIMSSSVETQNVTGTASAIDDAEKLLESLSNTQAIGRMVINLDKVISQPQSSFDVALKDHDRLHVPRIKHSVTIIGEVQFPTSHLYEEQLTIDDYLERSGNPTQKADKSRIYIVKANGSVFLPSDTNWFSFNNSKHNIEAGDTIVVLYDSDRMKPLPFWAAVTQIFYQVALSAAAVNSF